MHKMGNLTWEGVLQSQGNVWKFHSAWRVFAVFGTEATLGLPYMVLYVNSFKATYLGNFNAFLPQHKPSQALLT